MLICLKKSRCWISFVFMFCFSNEMFSMTVGATDRGSLRDDSYGRIEFLRAINSMQGKLQVKVGGLL